MSVEALWVLGFGNDIDYGSGVVVLETNRIFGGDSSFYWTGTYEVSNGRIKGTINVDRHSSGQPSIVGPDAYTMNIEGPVSEKEIELSCTINGQDRPALIAILTRTAELP